MSWPDLARVLGQPAPYWPFGLRIATLIAAWVPGAGAPDGLEKLTQIDWPSGTVLTRAQLEAARDGHPYVEE